MGNVPDLGGLAFTIRPLQAGYRSGAFTPAEVVREIHRRARRIESNPIWITLRSEEDTVRAAEELSNKSAGALFGVPFAIKDNIDAAGFPTTAGCPAFAYWPEENAPAVQRLLDAGAILIGKTNLDQFATGLVGTRSPYGICANAFRPEYISGGSSSGSALAVATGLVTFALGTDTAGSGRIPAAFSNIVGLKPTRGLISTRGVVPACRSLDCVSIFALLAEDAESVWTIAAAYDSADPYSRVGTQISISGSGCRIGVPGAIVFGKLDASYRGSFDQAQRSLESLGCQLVEVDVSPFLETAELLYAGPWVAERTAAVGAFIRQHPEAVHPVVRTIISAGEKLTAVDAFRGYYALESLRQKTRATWAAVDALLLPTAPTIYRIKEVEHDPIALNSRLGGFTNFTNLLDLAAVAVPAGFRADGLPFGVTLLAPAFSDLSLIRLAQNYLRSLQPVLGATGVAYPVSCSKNDPQAIGSDRTLIAVVGAHLTGEPLNYQLADRRARLACQTRTAPWYRLYALPDSSPPKPGLRRVGPATGTAIELEVWELATVDLGEFMRKVTSPLTIGTIQLENGESVLGFLCEEIGIEGATDISRFGGWKNYRASTRTEDERSDT